MYNYDLHDMPISIKETRKLIYRTFPNVSFILFSKFFFVDKFIP